MAHARNLKCLLHSSWVGTKEARRHNRPFTPVRDRMLLGVTSILKRGQDGSKRGIMSRGKVKKKYEREEKMEKDKYRRRMMS